MHAEPKRCFVIAEAGVNHNGSLDLAIEMIKVAKWAGADAIKFQTFSAELLVTAEAKKAGYQVVATGDGESQLAMLQRLELDLRDFTILYKACERIGIEFMSTPFDEAGATFLSQTGMRRFKVPSGEITNIRLIKHIARFGKPILLSTGMSDMADVERALGWISSVDPEIKPWLMHCVSDYPAKPEDSNLRCMDTMRSAFGLPTGLSDHTEGLAVALAAVALGADVLEKHFTLDRSMEGPDHKASLSPDELQQMIRGVREVEAAMGDGVKAATRAEIATAAVARRSVVASHELPAGTVLEDRDLVFKRPGTGIVPWKMSELIGRTLKVGVRADELIEWSMLE